MNIDATPNISSRAHAVLDATLPSIGDQAIANAKSYELSEETRAQALLLAEIAIGTGLTVAAALFSKKIPIFRTDWNNPATLERRVWGWERQSTTDKINILSNINLAPERIQFGAFNRALNDEPSIRQTALLNIHRIESPLQKLDFLKRGLADEDPEIQKVASAQRLDWTDAELLSVASYKFNELSSPNKVDLFKQLNDDFDKESVARFVRGGIQDNDPTVRALAALKLDQVSDRDGYLTRQAIKDPVPFVSMAAMQNIPKTLHPIFYSSTIEGIIKTGQPILHKAMLAQVPNLAEEQKGKALIHLTVSDAFKTELDAEAAAQE